MSKITKKTTAKSKKEEVVEESSKAQKPKSPKAEMSKKASKPAKEKESTKAQKSKSKKAEKKETSTEGTEESSKAPAEAGEQKPKSSKESKESAKETKKAVSGTPTSMEELLEMTGHELKVPKRGDVIQGVITDVNRRMVLVDIGAKTEGMVVEKEYEATKELIGDLGVGDEVDVYVVSPENDRGQILLSLKRAAVDRKWEQFEEYMNTGKMVKVKGLEVNRGGLIVAAEGLRGFVPSSQFGKDYLGKMDQLLDEDFSVKVIEVDKEKNRLIFSEREVSEAEAIENRNKALDEVSVDEIYEGVVSGIMPFGVFVTVTVPLKGDVGQLEGLVHISEISWEKVNDPNDYFTQGDRVKVKILGVDNGKLNLSVKQLSDDPWSTILKKYEVGTTVTGKVTRVEPFGVFVTLEAGVDGLIHISKIEAGKEPEVGKDIEVVVDSVDVENRRMSLGMVLTEVPLMYK